MAAIEHLHITAPCCSFCENRIVEKCRDGGGLEKEPFWPPAISPGHDTGRGKLEVRRATQVLAPNLPDECVACHSRRWEAGPHARRARFADRALAALLCYNCTPCAPLGAADISCFLELPCPYPSSRRSASPTSNPAPISGTASGRKRPAPARSKSSIRARTKSSAACMPVPRRTTTPWSSVRRKRS